MKPARTSVIEETEALSAAELEALADKATYILCLTIVSRMEQDIADFEGGDTWIFDEYRVRNDHQYTPDPNEASWNNTTLSLPGYKDTEQPFDALEIGGRYLAFYTINAMADAYSLDGLMPWDDEKATAIEAFIQRS